MATLRLYTSRSAFPNPQRLRLFMFEKGIEYTAIALSKYPVDNTPLGDHFEYIKRIKEKVAAGQLSKGLQR